jgi:hypothetical protein
MSITNIDLIADSLRELGVITEIQTPSAEQGAHALRKLNQMMAEWEESGVRLEYFEQTSTGATCPIPAYAENGVICMLATRLASNYGAQVSIELAASATVGHDTIVRTAVSAALPVGRMLNRPCGEGDAYPGNILTG